MHARFRLGCLLSATALVWCLASASATALPLNLNSVFPDISAAFIDVVYDSGSDSLSIDGFAQSYKVDGSTAHNIITGLFSISATIDSTGAWVSGSISITGTVAALGFNSGTLLTGTLAGFGFDEDGGPGAILEFTWNVTGGDAAGLFGATAGTILGFSNPSWTGSATSFQSDFDNLLFGPGTGAAMADSFPVPEPGFAVLLGLAFIGLLRRR